jgi:hypothetical protein
MSDESRTAQVAVGAGTPIRLAVVRPEPARVLVAEEQLAYARVLNVGMKLGLLSLVVTFAVYLLEILAPHIPVTHLPRYWSMPVKQYLAATGIHPGWGWVQLLHKGDFLNFIGIAFLAGVTVACYLAILPTFIRKKERIYGWLAVSEVLVLALAASGLLKAGGH